WRRGSRAPDADAPHKGPRREKPLGCREHRPPLGPREGDLSSTPRPLRTAALVARGFTLRGDRRRAPHATDRLAERGRGDPKPESGGPPRRASACLRFDPGYPEAREDRGPVPDEADAAPGFLSPPHCPLGRRSARLLRSPAR